MRFFSVLLCCWLLVPFWVSGQDFTYTNYDIKEGLAGSTVYCMVQDKDGFLWFGTETGLSRFDGTHFKNFYKEDGLPDNDIIRLFADSKGRVWIAPFKNTICYYYQGKIYTQQNDSLLMGIELKGSILSIAEDSEGNVLLMESTRIHLAPPNEKAKTILQMNVEREAGFQTVSRHASGGFYIVAGHKLFQYYRGRYFYLGELNFKFPFFNYINLTEKIGVWRSGVLQAVVKNFRTNHTINLGFSHIHTRFSILNDEKVARCTRQGAIVYNILTMDSIHYLKQLSISDVFQDNEGNMWFCSLGQGIYRLNSLSVMNLSLAGDNVPVQSVTSIEDWGPDLLVGTNAGDAYKVSGRTGRIIQKYSTGEADYKSRLVAMHIVQNANRIIIGGDNYLYRYRLRPFVLEERHEMTTKFFYEKGTDLLVATNRGVYLVDPIAFNIKDTIWHGRATAVFTDNDIIYIGTLNGLYCVFPNGSSGFMGAEHPIFKNSIGAICKSDDKTLWIATSDEGLVAYRNNRIIAQINKKNGLTSNNCRTIFFHNDELWVGTDKGLNKINLSKPGYPFFTYTTNDGLESDIINVIYCSGKKVYVGTAAGLTFFDEDKISRYSRCDLRITDILISNQSQAYRYSSRDIRLPNYRNNIRVDYVGISYKAAGDIVYRYRLLGLDSTWSETRETFLSYPTLPSGEYELQLEAINKFGVHSEITSVKFIIEKKLFEKTWFRVLSGVFFLLLTGLLIWYIARRIRKQEVKKTEINNRINELEQLALKAQMNPHFIFNSLNSIQQYVMDKDIAGANKFIFNFSYLIRKTLDYSSKQEINLADEIQYLTNYLELEKMRLEDKFTYAVILEDNLQSSMYFIPPMILQPYLENSVRHGIRLRKDKGGKIIIRISRKEQYLICVIEDNGVGRKVADRLKSVSPIEYQSKGMTLTADRIAMINKTHQRPIRVSIIDLEDEHQQPAGTRVEIYFPVIVE